MPTAQAEAASPAKFWMVLGIGQGAPTRQHASRSGAEQEAKRLARNAHGVTFVVLEAVTAIVKREFDIVTLREAPSHEDEMPF